LGLFRGLSGKQILLPVWYGRKPKKKKGCPWGYHPIPYIFRDDVKP